MRFIQVLALTIVLVAIGLFAISLENQASIDGQMAILNLNPIFAPLFEAIEINHNMHVVRLRFRRDVLWTDLTCHYIGEILSQIVAHGWTVRILPDTDGFRFGPADSLTQSNLHLLFDR